MSDEEQAAIAELNTRANLVRLLDELAENPERVDSVTASVSGAGTGELHVTFSGPNEHLP